MTKSEIFKAAHRLAQRTVSTVGNYSIALSLALKNTYKMIRHEKMHAERMEMKKLGLMFNMSGQKVKMPEPSTETQIKWSVDQSNESGLLAAL